MSDSTHVISERRIHLPALGGDSTIPAKSRRITKMCAIVLVFGATSVSQSSRHHFSTLQGTTVRMQPSGASFRVPQGWTLYLTGREIAKVKKGNQEWYSEYARIVNAALSFDDCSVQAGSGDWDAPSPTLQMRGYVINSPIDEVDDKISERGLAAAKGLPTIREDDFASGKGHREGLPSSVANTAIAKDKVGQWRRILITCDLGFFDYGGTANVEFYVRTHKGWTVILVFMRSLPNKSDPGVFTDKDAPVIQQILQSFSWPEPTSG